MSGFPVDMSLAHDAEEVMLVANASITLPHVVTLALQEASSTCVIRTNDF
jgi:hypothetical protein